MKVAVIGAGSWGTALAQLLAEKGNNVSLWARKPEVIKSINQMHRNPRYLTDVLLSENIVATVSHADAVKNASAAVIVTPSHLLRGVARALSNVVDNDFPIVICSKGVEEGSGLLPIEIFEAELGNRDRLAVLSGPNHAEEVIKNIPAGTVIASSSVQTAEFFQNLFATSAFRTYTSEDWVGVELCAAFKNVIAISVGLSYGLGFGDNTAAMLITRGMAEMSRMVVACGGEALTALGLAGSGDMVATCMSPHSRNRKLGIMIANGMTLDDFTEQTHMVAEGAVACKTLQTLSKRYNVELPITDIVRGVVWENADLQTAVNQLASRPLTTEFHSM